MPDAQVAIGDFQRSIPAAQAQLEGTKTNLVSVIPTVNILTEASVKLAEQQADLTQNIEQQHGGAALKVQQHIQEVSSQLGTNIEDSKSYLLSKISTSFRDNYDKAMAARDKVTEAKLAGNDSILSAIGNYFTMPSKIDEYNTYAENANSDLAVMDSLNSATLTAVSAQTVQKQNETVQSVIDQSTLASNKLRQVALDTQITGLHKNIDMQIKVAELNSAQLGNLKSVAQFQLASENLKMEQQKFDIMLEDRKSEDQLLLAYNAAAGLVGKAPLTGMPEFKAMRSLGGVPKEKLDVMLGMGMSILSHGTLKNAEGVVVQQGDGNWKLGTTPGNAMRNSMVVGVLPDGANNRVFEYRDSVLRGVSAANGNAPMKPEQYAEGADIIVGNDTKALSTNVESLDFHKNPYYAPGTAVISNLAPQIAATEAFRSTFGTLASAGIDVPDALTVMESAFSAAKKDPKQFEPIVEMIQNYYSTAAYHNNNFGGINAMGLPKQTSYAVQLKSVIGGSVKIDKMLPLGHIKVDMTDANQIRSYLFKSLHHGAKP